MLNAVPGYASHLCPLTIARTVTPDTEVTLELLQVTKTRRRVQVCSQTGPLCHGDIDDVFYQRAAFLVPQAMKETIKRRMSITSVQSATGI